MVHYLSPHAIQTKRWDSCNYVAGPLKKQILKPSTENQSAVARTQDRVVNTVEIGHPVDTMEALTALKDIKVLSEQIVRLHDRNHEVFTSESEL